MKLTSAIAILALAASGEAFAPASTTSRAFVSSPQQASSTELNLFGKLFRSSGPKSDISEEEVRALFYLWNDALATGDSRIVAKRYGKEAVLLPTVSDTPRTDYDSIKDYFDAFLLRKPQGQIVEGYISIGNGVAQDRGIYEFTMGDDASKVKARYTYVYTEQEDGTWKIAHHHSSILPESIAIGQDITKSEVQSLFGLWNEALATGDSSKVADRYAKNSVLLPTVSDVPRTDREGRVDYFNNFLQLQPQGVIEESNVLIGTNWAQDAGIYEFTLGKDGSKVRARYSFIYVYEDGEWKISHHHSSAMPEAGKKDSDAQTLTKEEARGLFKLWNDALATGNPDTVAKRYSKDAVLLPTVSDTPRTDYESIKDYFVSFLQKKPQGVITDGHVTVDDNWCKDAGVYEFTMGADGSKVKARYSFVYVFEDGEWKISHHHSSAMPEALLDAAAKVAEMEAVSS